ncbi:LssY C-terminal domain-containing protein [Vibrio profundum]|uniref:LssY C-terminal domain-containing protein n=1 Tax=Vibrio profundum TaxID=2910247 RepID=UPI003D0FE7AB
MFEGISLFFGALLDALIGPNLFVPGEPFFIAAGYQLHQGIWLGLVAVLLGGFIGDQSSYFIGRKFGVPAQRKLMRWCPKTRRPIARCRYLVAKKGNYVLAFARLLGPIAWVVPFIAGTNKTTWGRFTFYSTIGLVLGIGQFVMWGYAISYGIDNLPFIAESKAILIEHQATLIALAVSIIFFLIGKRLKWRFMFTKFTVIALLSMCYVNYAHFFYFSDDFLAKKPAPTQVMSVNNVNFKAYPGKSPIFSAQAVNVIYFGQSPRDLMNSLGWIENETFSRNDIEPSGYIKLMQNRTPPVSDLFWNGVPQDMAFQLPGDLMKRNHIRWWKGGVDPTTQQPFWVGALSYDNGLKMTLYSGIVTVLHSIEPNVDVQRDKLAQQMMMAIPSQTVIYQRLTSPTALDAAHDYYSDGRILVIQTNVTPTTLI